jgi:glycosyltransferase involved in cell wall biosynthesis
MQQERSLISVMVITYNHQEYIEQCILGILDQKTKYAFEIIIGDDASTDRTGDIVSELQRRYPNAIRLINEKDHVGFIPNYLRTLKYCKSDYIAFCEGDDFWNNQEKLERQVSFLIENPDYGLVYTDYAQFNESTKSFINSFLTAKKKHPISGFQPEKMVAGDCQIMTLTTCIRSSLLDADYYNIMDDNSLLIADFPTWMWIGLKSKIHYDNSITAVYRVHNRSITNSHTKESLWRFDRSHQYIRKKIMYRLNYCPNNWRNIDCQIQRGAMRMALKLKFKQEYGIAAFGALKKIDSLTFVDYITVIGLYCPLLTWPVRITLSVIRRITLSMIFLKLQRFVYQPKTTK